MSRKRSIAFLVVDFVCAAVLVCGILLFQVGKPYKRGFFCNDESIQKPYKDDTIPFVTGLSVGFTLVFIVVVGTELLLNHLQKTGHVASEPEPTSSGLCQSKVPPAIITISCVLCACFFGLVMNQFLTDIGKYSIGRLRPHFLDVCKPDWGKFNCTDERGNYVFIVDDVCSIDEGTFKAKDMRSSFPSGHSATAAFLMVFLALYIEAKLILPKTSKFLKPFIQSVLISIALYTGFSRVSDYKHHWSDVLAGFFLGISVAFVTIFKVLKPRFGREYQEIDIEEIRGSETEHVMSTNPKYMEDIP